MTQIRPAAMNDLKEILGIRFDAISNGCTDHYSALEIKLFLQDLDLTELREIIRLEQLYCAVKDNKIVAFAGWHENLLQHVYCHPDYSGQGITSGLVNHIIELYKNHEKVTEIYAECTNNALYFYQRLGFHIVSKETDWDDSAYYRLRNAL